MTALKAFGLAVLFACAWFVGVMAVLGGGTPSPLTHAIILLVPLFACSLIQHKLTRNIPLPPMRKVIQICVAAILAPVLATALIWFVWMVVLGHSE